MNRLLTIILIPFFVLSCGSQSSKSPLPTPKMEGFEAKLGQGVNGAETEQFHSCVKFEEAEIPAESKVIEQPITSKKELQKVLGTSPLDDAKHLVEGANQPGIFSDVFINDDAFYWLVDAKFDHTSREIPLDKVQLTAEARNILDNQGSEAFFAHCGTHFYSKHSHGARVSILYEFLSEQDRVVQKLKEKKLFDDFGIKAPQQFAEFLAKAQEAKIVKIHQVQRGAQLEDLSPQNLQHQFAVLANNQNQVATDWETTSYDTLVEDKYTSLNQFTLLNQTANLFELLTENNRLLKTTQARMEHAKGENPLFGYSAESWQKMEESVQSLESQNNALITSIKDAFLKNKHLPGLFNFETAKFSLQPPDQDFSNTRGWGFIVGWLNSSNIFNLQGYKSQKYLFFPTTEVFVGGPNKTILVKFLSKENEMKQILAGKDGDIIHTDLKRVKPNICIGAFADICNLRILEPRHLSDDDSIYLIVTIFDQHGFIEKTLKFANTEAE